MTSDALIVSKEELGMEGRLSIPDASDKKLGCPLSVGTADFPSSAPWSSELHVCLKPIPVAQGFALSVAKALGKL
jgi:hypothetical protein